jgi:hypothetical protein
MLLLLVSVPRDERTALRHETQGVISNGNV